MIAPAIPLIADRSGVAAVDVNVAISAYLVTVAVLIPSAGGWPTGSGSGGCSSPRSRCSPSRRSGARPRVAADAGRDARAAGRRRRDDGAGRPAGRAALHRKADLVRAIAYLTWPALVAPVLAPAIGGVLGDVRVLAVDLRAQRAAGARRARARPPAGAGPARRRCATPGPPRVRADRARRGRADGRVENVGAAAVALPVVVGGALAAAALLTAAVVHLRRAADPLLDLRILAIPELPGHRDGRLGVPDGDRRDPFGAAPGP